MGYLPQPGEARSHTRPRMPKVSFFFTLLLPCSTPPTHPPTQPSRPHPPRCASDLSAPLDASPSPLAAESLAENEKKKKKKRRRRSKSVKLASPQRVTCRATAHKHCGGRVSKEMADASVTSSSLSLSEGFFSPQGSRQDPTGRCLVVSESFDDQFSFLDWIHSILCL